MRELIDPKIISTGEFLRSDLELRGWNKHRKSDFKFTRQYDHIMNLELWGSHPVRSIKRGEVRPSISFAFVARNIGSFPPVLRESQTPDPLWTWSQSDITGRGPRETPGAVSLRDGEPFTGDILDLTDRFIQIVEEFDPYSTADSILNGKLSATTAGTPGIVSLLLVDEQFEVAEKIARKAFLDIKREIGDSEHPEARRRNVVETFGNLFAYYQLTDDI